MKPVHLCTLLAGLLVPSTAFAVPYSGNLVLSTQADVDAAAVYTSVTGSLTISGADISDLGPLSGLVGIGSYLSLYGNPSLTTVVDAFPALTDMGGGIYFYDNDSLVEFSGFDALLQTGDNIDFWFNDSLVTVSGFRSLHTAGWSLEFGGNPLLTDIPQFASLQTINSSLFILDNVSLTEITGFQALQYVDWSFQIQGNTSLNNLCGFYDYFSASNPYTGGGAFDIVNNGPALPNPTTIQDVIDAGPCEVVALKDLRALVVSLSLPKGIEKRLTRTLDDALAALGCGITCGASDAAAELVQFVSDVEQQRGKKLTDAEADQLIAEADAIIIALLMR